ncbi:hypothetical protein ZIOFF_063701 [Zingiber officinale]|uniref:Calcineurin-like phosphoesterase domain-containing protein n=1 Tax=Zingiber officinale TaxID=94328 RepID=A0A8J5KBD4_ZINOF|nr:hypothetical protein ZIOFF_063701 [Zingiber officinale]
MLIAEAWLPDSSDRNIMPTPRHRAPSRRPHWIISLLLFVCIAVIALYVYPPQRYSACYFLSSKVCGPFTEWLPPVRRARFYTDDELFARVVISDILSVHVESKNPKIAFMFLTPGSLPFEKLWERFFLVAWGKISMVDAEKRLLANALQDKDNQHFVLLSESCVPLHNFDYVYNYLLGTNVSFVDCFEDPGPHGTGRYSEHMLPVIEKEDFRKGAQWFSVKRQHAVLILADNVYYTKFKLYCRMVDPTGIANWSVTHVDWSEGKWHPKAYRARDVTFEIFKSISSIDESIHVTSDSKVADMHYGNGLVTRCRDVLPSESSRCTDVNSTVFLKRMIEAERPDLIAFTGDNIFGASATDAAESLFKVFRPAMESRIPWAAILGNHDQESTMPRVELMSFISLMDYSVAQVNPSGFLVDGYGNYDIKVHGAWDSGLANTSVLNLYFLDSGDRAMVGGRRTYGWIKDSQLTWLRAVSEDLQVGDLVITVALEFPTYTNNHNLPYPAPSLSFFHIPIPEVRELWFKGFVGQFQEAIACSSVNSGVLQTLVSMGDVKAVFIGHDHLNDFCGNLDGIWFCYGGGFGYHGYGKPSWRRRARVVLAQLGKGKGTWMGVEVIKTWKRLDDDKLTKIDEQVLWRRDPWEGQ